MDPGTKLLLKCGLVKKKTKKKTQKHYKAKMKTLKMQH